jgi:predicted metal-binding membrane protein
LGSVNFQLAGFSIFLALWVMWFMMAVAMMLPSAAPLIRTYCDIAETAQGKGMSAVHPLILLGGYLSVWGVIAVFFATLTLLLNHFGATESFAYPVEGFIAPSALALAGIYQFSGLKNACLTKCRNPFATLFGRWSDRAGNIFKLGVREGLYCAGCCWALMLVMFAVGTMNVFWMALLTLLAIVEKSKQARWVTNAIGVILLVWAAALMFIHI